MMTQWREARLGDLIELKRGYDLPSQERSPGIYPIVSSSGVTGTHREARVRGPGVVTGRYGTLGHVYFVDHDFWPLNTTLYVKDFRGNDPRFVSYFLKTLDWSQFTDKAAVPGVNRNHVHELEVRFPPLGEQRAIARVLGALDDKIQVNRRIARGSTALALGFGHQVLQPLGVGDTVRLEDCTRITKGVSYKSRDLVYGGGWLVSLKCVGRDGSFQAEGLKPYSGECKPEQAVDTGDVVVAQTDLTQRAEVIGQPARVSRLGRKGRLIASLDLVIVRPGPALTREVLLALLSTQDFRDHAISYCNGTTVLHMGARALPDYRFPMPPPETVALVTGTMRPLLERGDAALLENIGLAELRDMLLPKLLTGELSVGDTETQASAL